MTVVATLQSNYIPWKGYFDLIASVDIFVLYDVVQYTKNDWRNRNKLIANGRPTWLTIPVRQTSLHQTIEETEIASPAWARKHWRTIENSYSRSSGFATFGDDLHAIYDRAFELTRLSEINRQFIDFCCCALGIETRIIEVSELTAEPFFSPFDQNRFLALDKTARLVQICKALGASHYLSGSAAKSYLDTEAFAVEGIACHWMEYSGYPEYPQKCSPFEHNVSVLDLILNTGRECRNFLGPSKNPA